MPRGSTPEREYERIEKIRKSNTGQKRSAEVCKNFSEMNKKRWESKEYKEKLSQTMKETYKNPKLLKRLSDRSKGHSVSKETRDKIGIKAKERFKNPEYRKKCSESAKKRWASSTERKRKSEKMKQWYLENPQIKDKIGDQHRGEKNPWWKGGISFEPYCPKFTLSFKERVRAFFGYRCVECGAHQHTLEKSLSIHHVTFNKETCCDNTIPLFVPLCQSCHTKTNTNRIFWQYWFTEMVNHLYEGKCYLTKEEMVARDQ